MLPGLKSISCEERLDILGMCYLESWMLWVDMREVESYERLVIPFVMYLWLDCNHVLSFCCLVST